MSFLNKILGKGDIPFKDSPSINDFLDPWGIEHNYVNGITDIDDPSFLIFNIDISPSSLLFNLTDSDDKNLANTESFYNLHEGMNDVAYPNPYTLLTNLGEINRANYLKSFIKGFKFLIQNKPYIFQKIEGLESVMENFFSKQSYIGSKDDEGVKITCLESIDLKMNYLFMLYNLATFDYEYRRSIVPENLLTFDLNITLSDVRLLMNATALDDKDNGIFIVGKGPQIDKTLFGVGKATLNELKHPNGSKEFIKPQYTITLKRCKFLTNKMTQTMSEVTETSAGEQNTFTILLSYEKVEVDLFGGGYKNINVKSKQIRKDVFSNYEEIELKDSEVEKKGYFGTMAQESLNYLKGQGYDFLNQTEGRLSNFVNSKISNGNCGGNIEYSLEGTVQNSLRGLTNKVERLGSVSMGMLERAGNETAKGLSKTISGGVVDGLGGLIDKGTSAVEKGTNQMGSYLGNLGNTTSNYLKNKIGGEMGKLQEDRFHMSYDNNLGGVDKKTKIT